MSEIFNWLTGWFYNSEEDKTNKDNSYGTFSPKRPEHPSKPIKKIEQKVPLSDTVDSTANIFAGTTGINVPCKENK